MQPTTQVEHQLQQSISRRMGGAIQKAIDALSEAREVAVVCHIHPDADAIGSAAAMVMALRQRGIRAVASYGEDALPAKSLLTIPGWDFFVPHGEIPASTDTWVTVDCASLDRVGLLRGRIEAADRVINIDHHDTNEHFGTVNVVDFDAESTTMVELDLFEVWGIKLTRDMAHAMYAGLLTDTVSFHFGRARMHTAAARLLGTGLDPRTIAAQLLEGHPFEYLPFLGRVMATAGRDESWGGGAGLVHVTVAHDMMADVGHDEVEAVVNVVRTTAGGDVSAILKEYEPGRWRVSLRSRELVDVSQVASALGGGGHVRRAGLTHRGTADDALSALLGVSEVAEASRDEEAELRRALAADAAEAEAPRHARGRA
ncbi:DHH family phosphoesterase [Corynebacterium sp. 335C]